MCDQHDDDGVGTREVGCVAGRAVSLPPGFGHFGCRAAFGAKLVIFVPAENTLGGGDKFGVVTRKQG
jgi:hypothetical protein